MSAIQYMNQLYRENMQKKRTSRFNKKSGGKFSEKQQTARYTGKLEIPKLTYLEKVKLRKAIEERDRTHKRGVLIGLVIGLVIASGFIYGFIQIIQENLDKDHQAAVAVANYDQERYEDYLAYGDDYLNKQQWYNASFEYRVALKAKPGDLKATYRLAFALMRLCEVDERGCDEALVHLKTLEKSGYDSASLEELQLRWEGISQKNDH
ncbi:MAG: hypothetical protein AAGC47_10755 [Bacteroidota bacterium]